MLGSGSSMASVSGSKFRPVEPIDPKQDTHEEQRSRYRQVCQPMEPSPRPNPIQRSKHNKHGSTNPFPTPRGHEHNQDNPYRDQVYHEGEDGPPKPIVFAENVGSKDAQEASK